MDDGNVGDFLMVFSGKGAPDILTYTVTTNLTTGKSYRFYIVSENYVGLSSSASDMASIYICQAPSGLNPPTLVSSTSSQVVLNWTAPSDDGGCLITGYKIYVGKEASSITYQEVATTLSS
jgi:hypothetical protein